MSTEEKIVNETQLTKEEKKAAKKAAKREKIRAKRAKKGVVFFKKNKKGKCISKTFNFLRILFYPIHRLVYPFKFFGPHKVADGACIYVGNHYGLFDVFFPARTTWEGIHYIAKQSVLDTPVVGAFAQNMGIFGAMRDGSDFRVLMDSIKALRNGEKVGVFPEGTRNKRKDGELLPFHGGAAMMAIKAKAPIIPFIICKKPRPFHMTHIVFGEPMELTEYYDKKLTAEEYEEADNLLRNKLYELRDNHYQALAEKKAKRKSK